MSGVLWVPGAIRLKSAFRGGSSDFPNAGSRFVGHTTECPSGGKPGHPDYYFWLMNQVLNSKAANPQLLYDPTTDKLGQYMPLNVSGAALQNDGANRINRTGEVCVQIEIVGYAARPFTRYWKPGQNWQNILDSLESWGIPYTCPAGAFPASPTGPFPRPRDIWYSKAGWYDHGQAPGNSHTDWGLVSTDELWHGRSDNPNDPGVPKSVVWPTWFKYPGLEHLTWGAGRRSYGNLLIASSLAVRGYAGAFGDMIDREWGTSAQNALDNFKSHHGFTAAGINEEIWNALGKTPHVDTPDFPGASKFTLGESSEASLVMQSLLVLQGFASTLSQHATRRWRPRAKTATQMFQLSEDRLKSDPDGVPGPLTWQIAYTCQS